MSTGSLQKLHQALQTKPEQLDIQQLSDLKLYEIRDKLYDLGYLKLSIDIPYKDILSEVINNDKLFQQKRGFRRAVVKIASPGRDGIATFTDSSQFTPKLVEWVESLGSFAQWINTVQVQRLDPRGSIPIHNHMDQDGKGFEKIVENSKEISRNMYSDVVKMYTDQDSRGYFFPHKHNGMSILNCFLNCPTGYTYTSVPGGTIELNSGDVYWVNTAADHMSQNASDMPVFNVHIRCAFKTIIKETIIKDAEARNEKLH
ncbi:MAG: hypothetical protein EBY41_00805 [Proteobacteria bacterium]|nr:hypothetical protein [Pseudomonadota bacterium]